MLIHSQKIAQWGDPLTPPQSKTECSKWASGTFPWGGGWKTCVGWTTKWRHMEVEAFFDFNGPDDVGKDVKDAAIFCAVVAAGTAGVIAVATDGAAAVPAAQAAFGTCMTAKGIQEVDKLSVSFRTQSHWTDWA